MHAVGYKHSEETKRKIGLKNSGSHNGMYGTHLSESAKEHLRTIHKDRFFSVETRNKISLANKGRKSTEEARKNMSLAQIGKTSPMKGVKNRYSKETLERMSKANKGRGLGRKVSVEVRRKMSAYWKLNKEKRPNWKGGVLKPNKLARRCVEFKLWRETVYVRDDWTCQKHLVRGGKLHPHHILNFAEHIDLRYVPENGITLCEDAHREFHRLYGMSSNTFEQVEEYTGRALQRLKELSPAA